MKLTGKTALITGGNSGIGLATAQLFRDEGARLMISGRNTDSLEQARSILGESAWVQASDTADICQIQHLMDAVETNLGSLDILMVNAAIARVEPFEAVSETSFDQSVSINFKGAFFTIQKALPLLTENSSIIVTTSIRNQMGAPNFAVYAACKAALQSLVQTLGLELANKKIRINAISPGPIHTPMWDRFGLPPESIKVIRDGVVAKSPMGRYGEPKEIAQTALFLATDASSYITGQEIVVDGGMSLL